MLINDTIITDVARAAGPPAEGWLSAGGGLQAGWCTGDTEGA
jgi:hypothetical protein